MKKIKSFFKFIGGYFAPFSRQLKKIWQPVRAKIFWKREDAKKKKIIMIAVWTAIIVLLAAGLWFSINKLISDAQTKSLTVSGSKVTAKATILTSKNCGTACWDAQLFITALENKGVKIEKVSTAIIDPLIPLGRGVSLAKKYSITKFPTVVLEFTGDSKPNLKQFFSSSLGTVDGDVFVLTKILAPYYDAADKAIKGVVKITYLSDQTCSNCYDVTLHETALKNLGVDTSKSETYDVSSEQGKALISKYGITKVPTVIITGEISEYSALVETWPTVGVVESDGAYLFTGMDSMGGYYKDLKTGKIIKAKVTTGTK